MMASTQEEAKADRPALRAKPTTCTRGIEWQRQQKMLMNESDQKPSMRKTSPHNDPPDRVDFDAACDMERQSLPGQGDHCGGTFYAWRVFGRSHSSTSSAVSAIRSPWCTSSASPSTLAYLLLPPPGYWPS